jgi:hypothetical protein
MAKVAPSEKMGVFTLVVYLRRKDPKFIHTRKQELQFVSQYFVQVLV